MSKQNTKAWCLYFEGNSKEKEGICEWGVRHKYEIFGTKKAALKYIKDEADKESNVKSSVIVIPCEIVVQMPYGRNSHKKGQMVAGKIKAFKT